MKKFSKILSLFIAVIIMLQSASITAYAASQSQMVSKVIEFAEGEIGYKGTSSYSKYGEWYGYQGAWCTTFALWCFNQAGDVLGVKLYGKIVPSGGNCNSMISWYKNKGRYHTRESGYTPQNGDLVFFDWSGNGSSQHVGIVTGVSDNTIHTIEGNCSAQVKARKYNTTGSKPYNNVSAIMGYGSPDWGSVGKASPATTTKKTSTATKKSTTKKNTTKKTTEKKAAKEKTTSKKESSKTTAKKETTNTEKTKTTTTTTATVTETKSTVLQIESMELYAPSKELEIGDSVKLDYQITPGEAKAVVGYFCDEENIIEISQGGTITAVGEGTATVVVCANDEIYRQCDFTVTAQTVHVTKLTGDSAYDEQNTIPEITEKSRDQKLLELGINTQQIISHKDYYIIPLVIIGSTGLIALAIGIVKAISKKRK